MEMRSKSKVCKRRKDGYIIIVSTLMNLIRGNMKELDDVTMTYSDLQPLLARSEAVDVVVKVGSSSSSASTTL